MERQVIKTVHHNISKQCFVVLTLILIGWQGIRQPVPVTHQQALGTPQPVQVQLKR